MPRPCLSHAMSCVNSHMACRAHAFPMPCHVLIHTCHAAPMPCHVLIHTCHAAPMPFPCHVVLIHTCHAAPLPCRVLRESPRGSRKYPNRTEMRVGLCIAAIHFWYSCLLGSLAPVTDGLSTYVREPLAIGRGGGGCCTGRDLNEKTLAADNGR
jgi:hypothetical protein